jgi:hypothetical protein
VVSQRLGSAVLLVVPVVVVVEMEQLLVAVKVVLHSRSPTAQVARVVEKMERVAGRPVAILVIMVK